MIRTEALIFMCFTALFTTLGPVIAAIVFYRKKKYYVGSVFIGAAAFFVFQVITRIPLIQIVLPKMQWYQDMQNNLWVYALFLGLTAGLFEEVGRYLAFTLILKKHHDWENAVAFGIGHGGIEAILLVGLTYVSNLITSVMINSGMYDTILAQSPEQTREALIQAKNLLVQTPSSIYLVASAERLFAFTIHLALSVLVMVGIQKKKGLPYLGLAILLHMLVDSPVVIMSGYGVSVWVIEGFVFILAIISFAYIRKKGQQEKLSAEPIG
ncbi:MAG: YhfC family intramembrane metalloprotease [Ruminiclostridium sp.]|nr:YhfC family intramembrane metalloprotease [Ruminiclostridium sp.]